MRASLLSLLTFLSAIVYLPFVQGQNSGPGGVGDTSGTSKLKLWLDPTRGLTTDAQGRVSGWSDRSGNGFAATQTQLDRQPRLVPNLFCQIPALQFDGTNDFLTLGNILNNIFGGSGKQFTVFIVARANPVDNAPDFLLTKFSGPTCGENQRQFGFFINAQKPTMRFHSDLTASQRTINANVIVTGKAKVMGFLYDGTQNAGTDNGLSRVNILMNGTPQTEEMVSATGTLGNISASGTAPLAIGSQVSSTGELCNEVRSFRGEVAEIIIYEGLLNAQELEAVNNYLNNRYIACQTCTANAGEDIETCATSVQLNATPPRQGDTGTWTIASGPSGSTITPNNSPNATISGLRPGTYVLRWTVTNGNCDGAVDTVVIRSGLQTLTTNTSDTTICETGGSVLLQAAGAATYSWLPASDLSSTVGPTVIASPQVQRTYTVTGLDADGLCSATRTIRVRVGTHDFNPTVTPTNTTICLGASATLTAAGGATYAWAPATGLSATTGASVVATPQRPTTYTVTVTHSNGCTKVLTASVNLRSTPEDSTVFYENFETNNSIDKLVTNGWTNVNENSTQLNIWTVNNVYSGTNIFGFPLTPNTPTQNASITGSTQSRYLHIRSLEEIIPGFTSSNAYFSPQSSSIARMTTPEINTSNLRNVEISFYVLVAGSDLANGLVEISYDGGPFESLARYQNITAWRTERITSSNFDNRKFRLRFTWQNGSGNQPPFSLDEIRVKGTKDVYINAPSVTVTPANPAVCGTTSGVTLVASGADSYTWAPRPGLNQTTGATVIATPNATTTYTVTGTTSVGNGTCTNTRAVTVTVGSPPALSGSAVSPTCPNGNDGRITLTATGGQQPYQYRLGNGTFQASNIFSSLAPGSYNAVVQDANGCTANTTVTLQNPTGGMTITLIDSIRPTCAATGSLTVRVTGGTQPYQYRWSNGNTQATATNLIRGFGSAPAITYTLTVTDSSGCTKTFSYAFQNRRVIEGEVILRPITCNGLNNGQAYSRVNGGVLPFVHTWSTGFTGDTVRNLSANITYTLTITDAESCTATATFSLTQPSALNASTQITQPTCQNGSVGGAGVTVTGGVSPYTYLWSNGLTTPNVANLQAGNYTVTATDSNGCTITRTYTILSPPSTPIPNVVALQHVTCFRGNNGFINVAVTGGTTPYTYNWSNGLTVANLTGLRAGTYTLTVTDVSGCTATRVVTIIQPDSITLQLTVQHVNCIGANDGQIEVVMLGGTPPPMLFTWSNGQQGSFISSLRVGTYTVTVTDLNGCTATAAGRVEAPSPITVSGEITNVACFGQTNGAISATASNGTTPYFFAWSNNAQTNQITGLAPGIYTVTVTDGANCTVSRAFTIAEPTALFVFVQKTDVSCGALNSGKAKAIVSGGTAPLSYTWSSGETEVDSIINKPVGTYTVTVTDARGCTRSGTTAIQTIGNTIVLTTLQNNPVLCHGQNSGSILINLSGGTAPYSAVWSNGRTTLDLTNVGAGTYTVTVTDAGQCAATLSQTVTQPAVLNVSVTTFVPACSGHVTGSATASATGGISPYLYVWSNNFVGANNTNLAFNTYTVTVNDANGCTSTAVANVTQPNALNATLTTTNITCFGQTNGQISANISGGSGTSTLVWSTGGTSPLITNLSTGTYTVTVTDQSGCSITRKATITQPSAVTLSITNTTHVLCNGQASGSARAISTGGTGTIHYRWSDSPPTNSAILSAITAGTYTVTVTDSLGCTRSASVTITQPTAYNPQLTYTHIRCFGNATGRVVLSLSGNTPPYTYLWSNSVTTNILQSLTAGDYTVTFTDANNCTGTALATVTQPSEGLNLTAVPVHVNCAGTMTGAVTLELSGGTAPYSYLWSTTPPVATASLSNLNAGTYTVTVTDAGGCSVTSSGTVTQPLVLSAQVVITTGSGCVSNNFTATANATGGVGGPTYLFEWSNSATTNPITGLNAGIYTVTVTDSNGCTVSASATATTPNPLTVTFDFVKPVSCLGGSDGELQSKGVGGSGIYGYLWSYGGSTSERITGLAAGRYTVTVTDGSGCTVSSSMNLTEPGFVVSGVVTGFVPPSCNGSPTGSISVVGSGGVGVYSYVWSTHPVQTTSTATGLSSGVYTVTIRDANGCTGTLSHTLTAPLALAASSEVSAVVCKGGLSGGIDLRVSGGILPYRYIWSVGVVTEDLVGFGAGVYTVTVTDAGGCTLTLSAMIEEPVLMLSVVSESVTHVRCFGGMSGGISVRASGGWGSNYRYLWSNGSTAQNLSNLGAGIYSVTVTDSLGCSRTLTKTVTQPSGILAELVVGGVGCWGGSDGSVSGVVTGGTSPLRYQWNFQSGSSTSVGVSGLTSGTYTLTITDVLSCTSTLEVTITSPSVLTVSGLVSHVSCRDGASGSIQITSGGGIGVLSYVWSNGSTLQNLTNITAGVYTITVTDGNGCSVTSVQVVTQPGSKLMVTVDRTQGSTCPPNGSLIEVTVTGGVSPYSYVWSNGLTTEDIVNIQDGDYTVTVTDGAGCSVSGYGRVLSPKSLTLKDRPGPDTSRVLSNETCPGASNGRIVAKAAGGVGPYIYSWSLSGHSGDTLSGVGGGTYTVTVTDGNGCSVTGSFVVTRFSAPTLVGEVTHVVCNGGRNGVITSSAVVLGRFPYPDYVYILRQGGVEITRNRTGTFRHLRAGLYEVVVYEPVDSMGCSASGLYVVGEPGQVPVLFGATNVTSSSARLAWTEISMTSTYTLSYRVYGSSRWTEVKQVGSTSYTFSNNLQAGTRYEVRVQGSCGSDTSDIWSNVVEFTTLVGSGGSCKVPGGIYVELSESDPSVAQVYWSVDADPRIRYTLQYRVGNSGVWQSVNCLQGTDMPYMLVGLLSKTPYQVRMRKVCGLCPGALVSQVSNFSPVIGFTTLGSCASTFTLNGGISSLTACGRGTLTLDGAQSGMQYKWIKDGVYITGLVTHSSLEVNSGGVYRLMVYSGGCSGRMTESVLVTMGVSPSVRVGVSRGLTCGNGSDGEITASATGGGSMMYAWSNGGSGEVISGLSSGVYTVTVTSSNGCTSSGSVSLVGPTVVGVLFRSTGSSCGLSNGSIETTVTGGRPPYGYVWSSGSTSANISGILGGETYTITITDAVGCTTSGMVSLSGGSGPLLEIIGSRELLCGSQSDGYLTAVLTGGILPYRYVWSNGGTTPTISNLSSGSYGVTVTDGLGCVVSGVTSITSPLVLESTLTLTNALCYGQASGQAYVEAVGGVSPYVFSWSGGNVTNTSSTSLASGLLANVIYTMSLTDSRGCRVVRQISVTSPSPLELTISGYLPSGCSGVSSGIGEVVARGGSGSYRYQWSTGSATSVVHGLTAGSFGVTVTDGLGCAVVGELVLTAPSLPELSFRSEGVSCWGGSNGVLGVLVSGGVGPYSYVWSNGVMASWLVNVGAGVYTVTVTDGGGCTVVGSGSVEAPERLLLEITEKRDVSCWESSDGVLGVMVRGGRSPYRYLWSNGEASSLISGLRSGVYALTVTDDLGCTSTITGFVGSSNRLVVEVIPTYRTICSDGMNGEMRAQAFGGSGTVLASWNTGATTQVISGLPVGVYTVTVTDGRGCTAVATDSIVGVSPFVLVVNSDAVTCSGLSNGRILATVTVLGTPPFPEFYYELSRGGDVMATNSTGQFNNLLSGTYSLRVYTLSHNCEVIRSVSVGSVLGPRLTEVSSITSSGGQVNWLFNSGIVSYTLLYRVLNSGMGWQVLSNLTGTGRLLSGLQNATSYEVRLIGVCSGGIQTDTSASVTFTTLAQTGSCRTPGGLIVRDVTSSGGLVSWQGVSGVSCYLLSYGLSGTSSSTWPTLLIPSGQTSVVLSNLLPNSNYSVRIRSNCTTCSNTTGTFSAFSPLIGFRTGSVSFKTGAMASTKENQVLVYPNPVQSSGVVTLNYESVISDLGTVSLYDISGSLVLSKSVLLESGINKIAIGLPELSRGVYMLRLSTPSVNTTARLVIE